MAHAAALTLKTPALVACGGALGAAARYLIETASNSAYLTTFLINVSGSLLLGLLMGVLVGRGTKAPGVVAFAGTGFLGGFTTFSAYATWSLWFGTDTQAVATGYFVAAILAGIACAGIGFALGRAVVRP